MQNTHDPTDDDSTDRPTTDDDLGAAAYTAVGVLTEMQKRDAYYARDVDEAIEELEAGLETPGVAETPTGEHAAAAVDRLKELEAAAPDERASLIRAALADLAPVAAGVADHTEFDAGTDPDADTGGTADGDGVPLLSAVVTARGMLEAVDLATVPDEHEGRLLNALEALDNIYIDASPEDLATAVDTDAPDSDPAPDSDSGEYPAELWRPRPGERPTVPIVYQLPAVAADRAIDRFKHKLEYDNAPTRETDLATYIYDVIEEDHIFYVDGEPLAEYASDAGLETLTIEPDGE